MENRSRNYSYVVLVLVAFALGHFATANSTSSETAITAVNATTPSASVNNGSSSTVTSTPTVTVTDTAKTTTEATNNDTTLLPIDIYYEGFCKDCVNFMDKQFLSVYDKLKTYVNVNFIPFSQGTINETDGKTTFSCKRDGECDADKVHTCAIKYIQKKDDLVKFIVYALKDGFKNKTYPISEDTCVKESGINSTIIESIKECANNTAEYTPLLKDDYSKALGQNIVSVPRIVLNNTYSNETEDLAKTHFLRVVCSAIKAKPDACKDAGSGSETIVVGILPILISVYYLIRMF